MSALALGAIACGRAKKEAEEAMERAERFYGAMQTEAMKVLPTLTTAIGDSLQAAKDLMTAEKFDEARATALGVQSEAVRVAKLVPGKRTELDSVYKTISVEITYPVRQVLTKIQQVNATGSPPRGMSREAYDSLKKEVVGWESGWKEVSDLYQKGEIGPAASKAMEIKASVIGAMTVLGVK